MNKEQQGHWEYISIIAGRGGGIIPSQLDKMKADGWILESQNGLEYIFKRKIQEYGNK